MSTAVHPVYTSDLSSVVWHGGLSLLRVSRQPTRISFAYFCAYTMKPCAIYMECEMERNYSPDGRDYYPALSLQ